MGVALNVLKGNECQQGDDKGGDDYPLPPENNLPCSPLGEFPVHVYFVVLWVHGLWFMVPC